MPLTEAEDSMYGWTQGIDPVLLVVKNGFTRQVVNLAMSALSSHRVVSVIPRNRIGNRGQTADMSVAKADKTAINIGTLTPLLGVPGCRTMEEEIAVIRAKMYNNPAFTPEYVKEHKVAFFYDYLLSTSLCYFEIFEGQRVDKFFATKNRYIAAAMAHVPPEETEKYTQYLSLTKDDIDFGVMRFLKLVKGRGEEQFKISKPRAGQRITDRTGLKFADNLMITPTYLMQATAVVALEQLKNQILQFTYIKDNFTERTMCSTTNPDILMHYYKDAAFVEKVLQGVDNVLNRGYIRIPELGISRYDNTGVRALNLTRITQIEVVDKIDDRFIEVDFDNILPTFLSSCEAMTRIPGALQMLYEAVFQKPAGTATPVELCSVLQTWAKGQYAIGTTTFQRELHILMMRYPMLFGGYNGRPQSGTTSGGGGFNLGMV